MKLLKKENRRLKSRLAAASGDQDLYEFLSTEKDVDISYVQNLREKLRSVARYIGLSEAHNLSRESQAALEKLQEGAGANGITRLAAELDSAKKELQKLRLASEVGRSAKLQDEINALKLVEAQNAEVRVLCLSLRACIPHPSFLT